ncbi:MAG: PEP-CTERM sorting domain-containing protein, partial [Planctomycetia bacterium]
TSLLLVSDNGGGIRQDLYALAVVPEPSTWAVAAAGIACAAWAARRRRDRVGLARKEESSPE